ncbi:C39 family peptidase [Leifsonia sp. NCR5]|uniref:C39 family peptidase n=1 Tax=Leifsonia sp. NCR5 TaxID=1978342 RepID=UPI000A18B508|nr:C39 family peptidase [Leifsonia sp. NCR5]
MNPRGSPFPYESQWGDPRCNEALIVRGEDPAALHDWMLDGYATADEYRYWARNVCGLACLRSVVRVWRPSAAGATMRELIDGAMDAGALVPEEHTVRGLYYRPFLSWIADEFGLDGEVVEGSTAREHFSAVAPGVVAIASVTPEIRYPDRPNERVGGHLVLVHGFDGETVSFHNPSGIGRTAADASLPVDEFERFYAGRGMLLRD